MKQNSSIHPLLQDDQYHWLQLLHILESDTSQFGEDFQSKIQQLSIASSYALEQLCREPTLLQQLHSLKYFELDESELDPVNASGKGIEQVIELPLDAAEQEGLLASIESIRADLKLLQDG